VRHCVAEHELGQLAPLATEEAMEIGRLPASLPAMATQSVSRVVRRLVTTWRPGAVCAVASSRVAAAPDP